MTVTLTALLLVALATVCDLRHREIPDWISVVMLLSGIAWAWFGLSPLSWQGAFVGALIGFALTYPLFWLGGIGGGDVKLVTALGSLLGPASLLVALFWTAIAGGCLAVIAKWRGQSDFAYVPAILAGVTIAAIQSGGMG